MGIVFGRPEIHIGDGLVLHKRRNVRVMEAKKKEKDLKLKK